MSRLKGVFVFVRHMSEVSTLLYIGHFMVTEELLEQTRLQTAGSEMLSGNKES